jgi:hypothetical protein
MNPDLKLIASAPVDQDPRLVVHQARILADFIERSSLATSTKFVQNMHATISEAEAVANSVDLTAIANAISATARPASVQEIKRQLQMLIGAFPNTSKQDLSLFGVALLEDVVAATPTIGALTDACRHLRRSCRFVPAICEVLNALDEETGRQSAMLTDVREFRHRIICARTAAAEAERRVKEGFERAVRFCVSRIRCEQRVDSFDPDVVAEARRRISPTVDTRKIEANRERLATPAITSRNVCLMRRHQPNSADYSPGDHERFEDQPYEPSSSRETAGECEGCSSLRGEDEGWGTVSMPSYSRPDAVSPPWRAESRCAEGRR